MSIDHVQTYNFQLCNYLNTSGVRAQGYMMKLDVPAPFPPCSLVISPYQPHSHGIYGQSAIVELQWSDVKTVINIVKGTIQIGIAGAVARLELPESFPPAETGSFRFEGDLTVDHGATVSVETHLTLGDKPDPKLQPYAATVAASMTSRVPNNVAISFPRSRRVIWANEAVLLEKVPYLVPHLKAGFSESVLATRSDSLAKASTQLEPYTFDDSDEETDAIPIGNEPLNSDNEVGTGFKKIEIVDTAYTTYLSVLCWIATGFIEFAPLKSTQRFAAAGSQLRGKRGKSSKPRRSLPLPASPKSVYRLSHLFELPNLSKLAVDNFRSQLTPLNVAFELYTDAASVYPDLRDAALNYAVDNWKDVVKSKAYAEIEQRAQEEGGGQVNPWTSMLLMDKLVERMEK